MKINNSLSIMVLLLMTITLSTSCQETPCEMISCENGASCDDGVCACLTGYEGTTCADESRDKFEGNWDYTSSCAPSSSFKSTIGEVADRIDQVNMTNLTGFHETVTANIEGNNLFIVSQTVEDENGNSWYITSSTATLVDDSFTLNLGLLNPSGQPVECSLMYVKQ